MGHASLIPSSLLAGGTIDGNLIITGNLTVQGTTTSVVNQTVAGTVTITSASASALTVGRLGATTPALQVDASTATSITGIKVKSAAASGGVAVSAIGETNVNLTIDAAGSGTVSINATGTGNITLGRATTISNTLTVSTGGAAITGNVTIAGKLGGSGMTNLYVNSGVNTAFGNVIAGAPTTSTDQIGLLMDSSGGSTGTSSFSCLYIQARTAASAYNCTQLVGIEVRNNVLGSTSTSTSSYGQLIRTQTAGTTNNYGLYIEAPSGGATLNIGLYNAGTTSLVGLTTLGAATATTAGGVVVAKFGTSAVTGIAFGSGAPTVTATKGCLYLRTDGSGVNDRVYVNTDGGTTWTPIVTVG